MQLTLEVQDNEVPFLLKILRNFNFVNVKEQFTEDELDELYCISLYENAKNKQRDLIPMAEVFENIENYKD
jgi:hypothetical protein